MTFLDIYLPLFSALVSWSVVTEALHFLLGIWAKKQATKAYEEYTQKIANGELIIPGAEQFMNMDPAAFLSLGQLGKQQPAPTTSGQEEKGTGQYL